MLRGEPCLTRAEVREVDRIAIEELRIPGAILMENAGRGATELLLEQFGARTGPIAIFCGSGNNGGDGYVIARHLTIAGREPKLFATSGPDSLRGDALLNRRIVDSMGLEVHSLTSAAEWQRALAACESSAVLVDALLGTGFVGDVREPLASGLHGLVELRQSRDTPVLAIDLPSGFDADTGRPSNATVQADVTATFVARKIGFDAPGAGEWTGRVAVVGIGAPPAALARVLAARG